MCRNIRTLFNFDPPSTDEEIRAAALQFVRKVSGYRKPSKVNEEAFEMAVQEVADATQKLLGNLHTLKVISSEQNEDPNPGRLWYVWRQARQPACKG